jgi:hypothetical protein
MRRGGSGAVVVVLVGALLFPAGAHAAGGATRLAVTVDRARISTQLGHKFVFRSTITNRGPQAVSGLIAHLNIVSLRDGVYVDPEDWSSHRTRYLGPLTAGGSTSTTWRMQAVNAGEFGVYVAVLRRAGPAGPPTPGPAIRLAVAKRQTLNSGGILPLAIGIPALFGLMIAGLRLRRRA